jgi:hypothetical protein
VLSFLIAIVWGFFYIGFGLNRFDLNSGGADWSRFAPFYYSFVTMTTLGFGDITPKVDQWFLQIVVTIEVVLGYIMLGGLISIFSNKLARRAS